MIGVAAVSAATFAKWSMKEGEEGELLGNEFYMGRSCGGNANPKENRQKRMKQ